jgi:predicted regulator of Ras-like GTPase activity (Roadblock/LC7/MglB family)
LNHGACSLPGAEILETRAGNKKTEEKILDKIVSEGMLSSCSIVSKTGLHVAGDSGSVQKKETFAAMSAVVVSASETMRSDMKNRKLDHVAVKYDGGSVLLLPISGNYILVGIAEGNSDERALKAMKNGVESLLKEAPWLN